MLFGNGNLIGQICFLHAKKALCPRIETGIQPVSKDGQGLIADLSGAPRTHTSTLIILGILNTSYPIIVYTSYLEAGHAALLKFH